MTISKADLHTIGVVRVSFIERWLASDDVMIGAGSAQQTTEPAKGTFPMAELYGN